MGELSYVNLRGTYGATLQFLFCYKHEAPLEQKEDYLAF
ncbi:hypothetical protein SAMN05216464_105199 [Mucilaginibacter pineti]|uniref:Uncharacterized protein n=1 Tax=Mucilaginibacter pineti TaxID=1391627 RepID=A0A1G7BWQ7_9SPHI|nr:hypothetical protein SAMN05216464_105199 [Mucilaginibacter pineti]